MKRLNCVIIDDEPIAREAIADYCKEVPFLNVIAICKNALQANHYLQNMKVDLIFLDINMPLVSGMDWLKGLKNSPSIIMTTAYEEHALESFKYNVIDYLIKPISFERFTKAADKVYKYHETKIEKEVLFVKNKKGLCAVLLEDILFVEAMQNYVKIFTINETIITQTTLKSFKEQLPDYFIQTHKSYVVSKFKVSKVEGNYMIIEGYKVPISVRLKKTVLASF